MVEYDPDFCRVLEDRYAGARVMQGDAYDLPRTLAERAGEPVSAFVSSLPLLTRPEREREKLIHDAFALMGPDGVFVQFTYGLLSPVPRRDLRGPLFRAPSRPIWANLPPARVWTYRLETPAHAAPSRRRRRLKP